MKAIFHNLHLFVLDRKVKNGSCLEQGQGFKAYTSLLKTPSSLLMPNPAFSLPIGIYSACRFPFWQNQERQPGWFWGSAGTERAMRSFLIGPESSTVLLFPVRQSLVRHGMSSGPGLGPSCGGTPLTARRFRLHSQLMQGSSSFAPYTLDFLSVDPPPLRKFRKVFFCSNMFLLHCHEIHGLRSLRSLSSSARLWAQSHGFLLSFPNNSPVVVIKINETLRKMSDQNPMLLSLARKREIKYLFRSHRTTLYSGVNIK